MMVISQDVKCRERHSCSSLVSLQSCSIDHIIIRALALPLTYISSPPPSHSGPQTRPGLQAVQVEVEVVKCLNTCIL